MTKKIISLISFSALMLPAITLAAQFNAGVQPDADATASVDYIAIMTNVFNFLWILFMAFAIVMFLVAGFQFLSANGESDGIGKARMSVLWGSIGVAVGVIAFLLPFIIKGWIF